MINLKFVGLQYKNIWIPLLIFGIIFGFLIIILGVSFPTLGRSVQSTASSYSIGAAFFLNIFLFDFPAFVLFWVFATILSSNLANKDISRGYIASWLTTSMSRTTIFNSKLFTIVSSILMINLWMIILELLIFGLRMEDFTSVVGNLMLGNLDLLMFAALIGALNWIVFSSIKKTGLAIGVSLLVGAWFSLCSLLLLFQYNSGLENLKYFQYFTILSLLHSPLQFEPLSWNEWNSTSGIVTIIPEIAKISPVETKNFVWQIPTMFVVSVGLFTGAQFIIKDKDFAF